MRVFAVDTIYLVSTPVGVLGFDCWVSKYHPGTRPLTSTEELSEVVSTPKHPTPPSTPPRNARRLTALAKMIPEFGSVSLSLVP